MLFTRAPERHYPLRPRDLAILRSLKLHEASIVDIIDEVSYKLGPNNSYQSHGEWEVNDRAFIPTAKDITDLMEGMDSLGVSPERQSALSFRLIEQYSKYKRVTSRSGFLGTEVNTVAGSFIAAEGALRQGVENWLAKKASNPKSNPRAEHFQQAWLEALLSNSFYAKGESLYEQVTRRVRFTKQTILRTLRKAQTWPPYRNSEIRVMLMDLRNRRLLEDSDVLALLKKLPPSSTTHLTSLFPAALKNATGSKDRLLEVLRAAQVDPQILLKNERSDDVPLYKKLGLSTDEAKALSVEIFRRGQLRLNNERDGADMNTSTFVGLLNENLFSTEALFDTLHSMRSADWVEVFHARNVKSDDEHSTIRHALPKKQFYELSLHHTTLKQLEGYGKALGEKSTGALSPKELSQVFLRAYSRQRQKTYAEALEMFAKQSYMKDSAEPALLKRAMVYFNPYSHYSEQGIVLPPDLPAALLRDAMLAEEKQGDNPFLLPGTTAMAFDRVKRSEVAQQILKSVTYSRGLPPKKVPADSLEVLAEASGLSLPALKEHKIVDNRNANALGDFYSMIFDLVEKTGKPLFKDLRIQSGNPSELVRLFTHVRTLYFIKHHEGDANRAKSGDVWEQVCRRVGLNLKGEIPGDAVKTIADKAHEELLGELEQFFDKNLAGINFEEAIPKLESELGDLDPFYVLMGRYSGTRDWRPELKVLGDVFSATLRGNFRELKYRGNGTEEDNARAAEQLKPLDTDEKKEIWMSNHSLVDWNGETKALTESERKAAFQAGLQEKLNTNLTPHLGPLPSLPSHLEAQVIEMISSHRGDPKSLKQQLEKLCAPVSKEWQEGVVNAVANHLKTLSEPQDVATVAGKLARMIDNPNADFQPRFKEQEDAKNDLRELAKMQEEEAQKLSGESFAISATFDDPKLLMMTGALHSDNSCQRYDTGGLIDTLPGYVIDANVKGMLGAVLSPSDFADFNPKLGRSPSFELMKSANVNGKSMSAEWKPGKKGIYLEIKVGSQDGGAPTTLRSKLMNVGHRRHVMKLGSNADGTKAAAMLERAYTTGGLADPRQVILGDQSLRLLNEIAHKLDAVVGEEVQMAESRNNAGVYSDAAGGKRVGPYVTPANPSQRLAP